MNDFDKTLTSEELAAPTFLEWSDSALARGVRTLAAKLHDSVGSSGIIGMAAALALEKVARDSNAAKYEITIDGGTRITVRLPNEPARRAVPVFVRCAICGRERKREEACLCEPSDD